MAISYGPTYAFTFIYTCILPSAFILSQTQRISQTQKYSYFLTHTLSRVSNQTYQLSHKYPHTFIFHLFSHTQPLTYSDSFLYFLKPSHTYSVTYTKMMKVTHSSIHTQYGGTLESAFYSVQTAGILNMISLGPQKPPWIKEAQKGLLSLLD